MPTYRLRKYAEPSVEPVSLTEFKLQARIDGSAEDTLLAILIEAARHECENKTGRALVETTYDLWLDDFPDGDKPIRLPFPPLQSITHLKYYDGDGVQQTLTASDYQLTSGDPAFLYPAIGESWPSVEDDHPLAVNIRFITGYPLSGVTPTTPEALRLWVLMRATALYQQRTGIITGTISSELPRHIDGLIDSFICSEALI